MAKYLIDANVFIQAKNMYYRFDFCGGFWDWLKIAHENDLVFSIKKVKDELTAWEDNCCAWVKTLPDTFFIDDMADAKVMAEYRTIMKWIAGTDFKDTAKKEFAKNEVADAFLIAAAKAHGYTVVTQEQSNPASRRKIYLPDAAAANNVKTMYVYDMLSQHTDSTFIHRELLGA
nr:DUF4411 family protein [Delftia acidovorans]